MKKKDVFLFFFFFIFYFKNIKVTGNLKHFTFSNHIFYIILYHPGEDTAGGAESAQQPGGQWGWQHQHQAQVGAARPQWGEHHQLRALLEWHLHTLSKCSVNISPGILTFF